MYTLYNVTEGTKKLIKGTVILIASAVSLYILFNVGILLKNVFFPTPPPKTATAFGKLPEISFPQSTIVENLTYTIDTTSGNLPIFPDMKDTSGKLLCISCITVHLLATPTATLDSFTNAQGTVRNVGFQQQAIPLSERRYQWINPNPPTKKIIYDIVSHNFTMTSNFLSDPDVLSANGLTNERQAIDKTQEFLSGLGAIHDDIDQSKTKTMKFHITGGTLTPASSLSNTQIIRVDYFQQDLDGHSIYYPIPNQSTMNAFIAGGQNLQVVESQWTYYPISPEMSTYPIYTPTEAFELLKKGNAYIASYKGTTKNIAITNMKVGYYMGEQQKDNDPKYLMPIIVIEGKGDFVAYLSAVKSEWIGK